MSILASATAVLRLMASTGSEVTVSDLALHLSMPKSSASRLLKQMGEVGLLERDGRSLAYRPTLLLLEVAHLVCGRTPLFDMMDAALRELTAETGHTGYISVLEGRDVIVLRVSPGTHALRVVTFPGHRGPAWATSTGRSLLARLDDETIAARLADIRYDVAPGAPQSFEDLSRRIALTRRERYAVAVEEAHAGIGSVGTAILDPARGESFSLCLTFPAGLARSDEISRIAGLLVARAAQIGRAIGDPAWSRQNP